MPVVFWGAGVRCPLAIDLIEKSEIQKPDYIVDSDIEKSGKIIKGIEVISSDYFFDEVDFCLEADIYITFCDYTELKNGLIKKGFAQEKIHIFNYSFFLKKYIDNYVSTNNEAANNEKTVVFDLENGVCLGGVESWVYKKSNDYYKLGFDVKYLIPYTKPQFFENNIGGACEYNVIIRKEKRDIEELEKIAGKLAKSNCTIVVSNFLVTNYWVACIAKKINPNIYHIAIVHSDSDFLYNQISELHNYVDLIVVLSNKMVKCLKKMDIPENKIKKYQWTIPADYVERTYSKKNEPIRIGYAGRITINLKRFDAIVYILKELYKRNIPFVFEFAGDGDYKSLFLEKVKDMGIEKFVRYKGVLNENEMASFWRNIDVMLSCSEVEGHSISQCEAMSHGVVPVLTDVSGASDDVKNGCNGFIYPINDYQKAVEIIELLVSERELLSKMGNNARSVVDNFYNEKIEWVRKNH